MARTRAERRANTQKKCKARKALTTCPGTDHEWGPLCSGNITPSGERTSCPACEAEKRYIWNTRDFAIRIKKIDDAWWKAQY